MNVSIHIVHGPQSEPEKRNVAVGRVPVLGEYILDGNDWFEVKRVVHFSHGAQVGQVGHEQEVAEVFAVPVVDPTREPLTLSEWLEPAPHF